MCDEKMERRTKQTQYPDCVFQLAAAKVFVVSYVNNLKRSVLKHFR